MTVQERAMEGIRRYGSKFATALHEAGHAGMVFERGKGVHSLERIRLLEEVADGESGGECRVQRGQQDTTIWPLILASGVACQRVLLGRDYVHPSRSEHDRASFTRLRESANSKGTPAPDWDRSLSEAEAFFRQPQIAESVLCLAEALMVGRQFRGEDAEIIWRLWR